MKVTAIVLNWNGKSYISHCLKSLEQVDKGSCQLEIIVVDNDSGDDSVSFISARFPEVVILRNPTNLGYAAGNNTGLEYALDTGADYVWILNPDIKVDKTALIKFIEGSNRSHRDGIFGCKIYFAKGFETYKEQYSPSQLGRVIWYAGGIMDWANCYASHRGVDEVDSGQFDRDFETDFITGASMFIKRSVLESVGFFDAKYFLYLEDNDLCQRAKRAGYKTMFLYQPTAWHENAQSTGLGSALQDYYLTRNRLLFGMRYAPMRTKLSLIRESYQMFKTGRPWQKRGVMDFYAGNFGAGSFQTE